MIQLLQKRHERCWCWCYKLLFLLQYQNREDSQIRDVMSKSHAYRNTITKGNLLYPQCCTSDGLSNWLSSIQYAVIPNSKQVATETRIIQVSHFPRCRGKQSWMFATGPGNLPAEEVRNVIPVLFSSRMVPTSDALCHGGPQKYLNPSTSGRSQVSLEPSAPISGSGFWVWIFLVVFKYSTTNREILTVEYHCPIPWN